MSGKAVQAWMDTVERGIPEQFIEYHGVES
jgi:hypothetical protein